MAILFTTCISMHRSESASTSLKRTAGMISAFDGQFRSISITGRKNGRLLAKLAVSACQKRFLTSWWTREQAPPPLPPLPVFAEILRISGRENCKETIFALENGILRRKNPPAPAVHAAGYDLYSRGLWPSRALLGFFDSQESPHELHRSDFLWLLSPRIKITASEKNVHA